MKPIIGRIKNKEWKRWEGTELPQNIVDILTSPEVDAFRSRCSTWYCDTIWYKGESLETTDQFTIVFNDGWYYKVDALFAFWHPCSTGKMVMQCSWSYAHLKRNMRSFLETGKTVIDPFYQT